MGGPPSRPDPARASRTSTASRCSRRPLRLFATTSGPLTLGEIAAAVGADPVHDLVPPAFALDMHTEIGMLIGDPDAMPGQTSGIPVDAFSLGG